MQRKMFFVRVVLSFAAGLLVWYFGHGMIRFYAGDGIAVFFLYACVSLVTPSLGLGVAVDIDYASARVRPS